MICWPVSQSPWHWSEYHVLRIWSGVEINLRAVDRQDDNWWALHGCITLGCRKLNIYGTEICLKVHIGSGKRIWTVLIRLPSCPWTHTTQEPGRSATELLSLAFNIFSSMTAVFPLTRKPSTSYRLHQISVSFTSHFTIVCFYNGNGVMSPFQRQ